MDKLKKLQSLCKAAIYISINQHKNYYKSIKYYLTDLDEQDIKDIPKDVQNKIIELDTIIEVQFYPDTPVGFYKSYHYDLDLALDEALSCFEKEKINL